jgi:very-short-patch-repair endonuclease
VTAAQLRGLGVSYDATHKRALRGRLHRVHHGVYAVGHRPAAPEARFHAAALAVGEGAVVSYVSAGVLWGLIAPDRARGHPVDVTSARALRPQRGIRVHRSRTLRSYDRTRARGVPVTSPARTLLDLADVLPVKLLRRAVREAEAQRLVDEHALARQLRRARGRRGAPALAALVDFGPAPTRSELEDRTLALLLDNGLPRPQINPRVAVDGQTFVPDFLFPQARLVVEADGERYHSGTQARQADAHKQARLEAAGYRVVRVSWRQVVEEPALTVSRVRRGLAQPPAE